MPRTLSLILKLIILFISGIVVGAVGICIAQNFLITSKQAGFANIVPLGASVDSDQINKQATKILASLPITATEIPNNEALVLDRPDRIESSIKTPAYKSEDLGNQALATLVKEAFGIAQESVSDGVNGLEMFNQALKNLPPEESERALQTLTIDIVTASQISLDSKILPLIGPLGLEKSQQGKFREIFEQTELIGQRESDITKRDQLVAAARHKELSKILNPMQMEQYQNIMKAQRTYDLFSTVMESGLNIPFMPNMDKIPK